MPLDLITRQKGLGRRDFICLGVTSAVAMSGFLRAEGASARPVAVVLGRGSVQLERLAATELSKFAGAMLGKAVQVMTEEQWGDSSNDGPVFILGTAKTNGLIAQMQQEGVIRLPESSVGTQGFLLKGITWRGRSCLVLGGEKPIGVMYAVYHYLEAHCGVGFFMDGERVPNCEGMPFRKIDDRVEPHFEHRGYMVSPTWTRPYIHSCRLWSFDEWKRMIDWMRRKRFNRLVLFHDCDLWGDVIFREFPELQQNAETLKKYVVDPAYRTQLNQRIFRYARENGISIVYNLFYSQVPDFFQTAHPELMYHLLQMENVGICASQPDCRRIMRRFWGKIIETYGVDDSHLYLICPYQHEGERCSYFPTSAPVAVQAYEVLKEIDPQAQVSVETWCWGRYWLKRDMPREWHDFLRLTPKEVGVADLDRSYTASRKREEVFDWYRPRSWLAWRLLSFEAGYPPSFVDSSPQELITDLRIAADHGASGVIAFNIVANSNALLGDLSAELGWNPNLKEKDYLEDYVRRRYGESPLPSMLESQQFQIQATDPALRLVANDTCFPPETELHRKARDGDENLDAWIAKRLERYRVKYQFAVKARERALTEARNHPNDSLYAHDLWELNYIVTRWQGCISFYEAYRSLADPERSNSHFREALERFYEIKAMFAIRPEYSMANLPKLGKDVPYLPHFLKEWDTIHRRWTDIRPYYYPVWEHFDRYEWWLRGLDPKNI